MTSEPTPPLVWVRQPLQARSQATLTRLLDATEELLENDAFDNLSVQAICKQAKSSVGAFYTRFPDKIALLHLLHERVCEEARATAALALDPERWRGHAIRDVVTAMVQFIVLEYRTRCGLRRELVRRNGLDPAFRERSIGVATFTAERLAALLAERQSELKLEDPRLAAEMVHRILFSALDQHAVYGTSGPAGLAVPDEVLARELSKALLAYLGACARTV